MSSNGPSDKQLAALLHRTYQQTFFHPLESAPEGWPRDGKYFPLGPNSAAKGDWQSFWKQVAVAKRTIAAAADSPSPPGPELSAAETVQDAINNLRTHVLATVYCPAWAHGWASMLLLLITAQVSQTHALFFLAIKGGPASDEEVAFIYVLLGELGFTLEWSQPHPETGKSNMAGWLLERNGSAGAKPMRVEFYQYENVESTNHLEEMFAPCAGYTAAPNLRRWAVVSCAEKWFLNGKSVRINEEEVDDDHPQGMTVNDRLNANLLMGLARTKAIAAAKGFRPMRITDPERYITPGYRINTEAENRLVNEYFTPVDI